MLAILFFICAPLSLLPPFYDININRRRRRGNNVASSPADFSTLHFRTAAAKSRPSHILEIKKPVDFFDLSILHP